MKPGIFESMPKGLPWYPRDFGPFRNSPNLTTPFDRGNRTLVSGLFRSRSPSAIFRRISEVVVYSIYGCALGRLTHISKKILELLPSFTYRDATRTIVRKRLGVRIFTSLSHAAPNVVDCSMGHSVSGTVSGMCLASARIGSAVAKIRTVNNLLVATRADAEPHGPAARAATRIFKHFQMAKFFTNKINSSFAHFSVVPRINFGYQYKSSVNKATCMGQL